MIHEHANQIHRIETCDLVLRPDMQVAIPRYEWECDFLEKNIDTYPPIIFFACEIKITIILNVLDCGNMKQDPVNF